MDFAYLLLGVDTWPQEIGKAMTDISALQDRMAQGVPLGSADETTVRRLWWGALETLQKDILPPVPLEKGLWLAAPLPALYEPKLLAKLQGWVWAPDQLERLNYSSPSLLPSAKVQSSYRQNSGIINSYTRLPLRNTDGDDPLLIVISPEIQIALALHGKPGNRNLIMRSDQDTFADLLEILDLRLSSEDKDEASKLRYALADMGELTTNKEVDKLFWPSLAFRLSVMAPSLTAQAVKEENSTDDNNRIAKDEITLLEAITHEVRTPLATIRILIRSLLRRNDISELVTARLKQIDSECNEQIDRFGLIFNAVELQRQDPAASCLAVTDLGRMLEMLFAGWSKQLERRGVKLELDITPDLPDVLSDPERLELMLGGLIDRTSRGLKPGASLSLELRPAGHRLKLQILTHTKTSFKSDDPSSSHGSDLGPVLSWNPSTGSLQLTNAATQRLFASLGGRLKLRKDSGLTVFFPIAESKK